MTGETFEGGVRESDMPESPSSANGSWHAGLRKPSTYILATIAAAFLVTPSVLAELFYRRGWIDRPPYGQLDPSLAVGAFFVALLAPLPYHRWMIVWFAVGLSFFAMVPFVLMAPLNEDSLAVDSVKMLLVLGAFLLAVRLGRSKYAQRFLRRHLWLLPIAYCLGALLTYEAAELFLGDTSLLDRAEIAVNRVQGPLLYCVPLGKGESGICPGLGMREPGEGLGLGTLQTWQMGSSDLQNIVQRNAFPGPVFIRQAWSDLSGQRLIAFGTEGFTADREVTTTPQIFSIELDTPFFDFKRIAEGEDFDRMLVAEPLSPDGGIVALPGGIGIDLETDTDIKLVDIDSTDEWVIPVWAPRNRLLVYVSQDDSELLFIGTDHEPQRQLVLPGAARDGWVRINDKGDVCYLSAQDHNALIILGEGTKQRFMLQDADYDFPASIMQPRWVDNNRIAYIEASRTNAMLFILDVQTGKRALVSQPFTNTFIFAAPRAGGSLFWLTTLDDGFSRLFRLKFPSS